MAHNTRSNAQFPQNFRFGVATSSYQIEGGWNEDGKSISAWDALSHSSPSMVADGSTGDIACDSYHKWQDDIRILKELGVNYYRFSLAWTRILPDAFSLNINQAGVDYYNNLINALIENDIEPVVTIYHWEQPQRLRYMGAVANSVWIQYYVNFARTAFRLFGDRVKTWITFNEANIISFYFNRVLGEFQPQYPNGVIEYVSVRNILLAHAEAYHIYDKEFRARQGGKVGIVLNFEWSEPASDTPADIEAAERRNQFDVGIFANPILNSNYPQVVIDRIAQRSKIENCSQSRLEPLTMQEKLKIKGTSDFIGINYYTTWYVADTKEPPLNTFGVHLDHKVSRNQDSSWESTGAGDVKVVPWGLRKVLNWVKDRYNNPEILITECGHSDRTGTLDDDARINFYREHLNETLKAITEDGVNVTGFTAWSLMDNFEWTEGYLVKYGLYHVDFNDPERPRTAKKSAKYYKRVIATRSVVG